MSRREDIMMMIMGGIREDRLRIRGKEMKGGILGEEPIAQREIPLILERIGIFNRMITIAVEAGARPEGTIMTGTHPLERMIATEILGRMVAVVEDMTETTVATVIVMAAREEEADTMGVMGTAEDMPAVEDVDAGVAERTINPQNATPTLHIRTKIKSPGSLKWKNRPSRINLLSEQKSIPMIDLRGKDWFSLDLIRRALPEPFVARPFTISEFLAKHFTNFAQVI
mmetsp:Transcript_11162/g.41718  ORF Transcript_11162/g.41718 Transcript_11162/m.41718 type:complete len:227 (+) Transcript_11162:238-918(+)